MFSKRQPSKKTEDVKKSASKVLDPKRDTPTRAKHLRIFLDNADNQVWTTMKFVTSLNDYLLKTAHLLLLW